MKLFQHAIQMHRVQVGHRREFDRPAEDFENFDLSIVVLLYLCLLGVSS
jgi:hypothetical protein